MLKNTTSAKPVFSNVASYFVESCRNWYIFLGETMHLITAGFSLASHIQLKNKGNK